MSDDHAYGHSSSCYWCGFDPDEEPERPCDERLNKRPTEAQMRHYQCTSAIEDARYELEQAELVCEENGYRDAAKDVYDVRLRLSDALLRLESLCSSLRLTTPSGDHHE